MSEYNEEQYQKYLTSCAMKRVALQNFPQDLSLECLYDWCKSFTEDYGMMEYYKDNKEK